MRENPAVCFQTDSIDTMVNWRSVIVWGEFEELRSEEEQRQGLKILNDRFGPYVLSESVKPSHGHSHPPEIVEKGMKPIIYRIRVTEKSGRYEKLSSEEYH